MKTKQRPAWLTKENILPYDARGNVLRVGDSVHFSCTCGTCGELPGITLLGYSPWNKLAYVEQSAEQSSGTDCLSYTDWFGMYPAEAFYISITTLIARKVQHHTPRYLVCNDCDWGQGAFYDAAPVINTAWMRALSKSVHTSRIHVPNVVNPTNVTGFTGQEFVARELDCTSELIRHMDIGTFQAFQRAKSKWRCPACNSANYNLIN